MIMNNLADDKSNGHLRKHTLGSILSNIEGTLFILTSVTSASH